MAFTNNPTYTETGNVEITGDRTASVYAWGLTQVGDKFIAKLPIANTSVDLTAYLSCSVTSTNTTYFKVTSTLDSTTLEPQTGVTNLNITIELIKTPVTAAQEVVLTAEVIASPTPISSGGSSSGETNTAYSIGDEVTIGTESFYVIENSDETQSTVLLLAKENIDIDNLVQDENAGCSTLDQFSETNYWASTATSYPYDLIETGIPDSTHYAAYPAYQYGAKLGGTGRLLRYSEASALLSAGYSWIYHTGADDGYWLGTAADAELNVWCVDYEEIFYQQYDYHCYCGVRPVVEISKSKIS